jgi:hypothetical protein
MMNQSKHTRFIGTSSIALAVALSACGDLKSPSEVRHVAYTNNGDISAFLAKEMVLLDGNLKTEKSHVRYVGPPEEAMIDQASISADGKVVAIVWYPNMYSDRYSYSEKSTIDVFTAPERQHLMTISTLGNARELKLDPTGNFLAYYDYYIDDNGQAKMALRLYDIATSTLLWTDDQAVFPCAAVFSTDGSEIYSCSHRELPSDDQFRLGQKLVARNARTGEIRFETPSDIGSSQLGLSPDGSRIIAGRVVFPPPVHQPTESIGFWQTSDGQLEKDIPTPSNDVVMYSALSLDGHFAVVLEHYWDVESYFSLMVTDAGGSVLYIRKVEYHGELAFSPDGTRILMSPPIGVDTPQGFTAVFIYDTATGDEVATKTFNADLF